jgi:hypothetical protein
MLENKKNPIRKDFIIKKNKTIPKTLNRMGLVSLVEEKE